MMQESKSNKANCAAGTQKMTKTENNSNDRQDWGRVLTIEMATKLHFCNLFFFPSLPAKLFIFTIDFIFVLEYFILCA